MVRPLPANELSTVRLPGNQARAYAPSLGRFISRDRIGLAGGINVYAYCGDDPVNLVDPDGLSAGPLAIVLGAYNACAGSFRASDVYVSEHYEDYTWYGHIWANTKGAGQGLINTVNPVAWWNGLRGAAEEFGDTAGRYDSGKATAADVAWAGGKFGLGLGATSLGTYAVGKLGVAASRPFGDWRTATRALPSCLDVAHGLKDQMAGARLLKVKGPLPRQDLRPGVGYTHGIIRMPGSGLWSEHYVAWHRGRVYDPAHGISGQLGLSEYVHRVWSGQDVVVYRVAQPWP